MAVDVPGTDVLRLLQADGRMSVPELAARLRRPLSAVRERVRELEFNGFILGYQARLDWSKLGLPGHAVLTASCCADRVPTAAASLRDSPLCTEAMLLPGDRSILATMRVHSAQHFASLLRANRTLSGLDRLEADLALDALVPQRPPMLPDGYPRRGAIAKAFPITLGAFARRLETARKTR